MTDDARHEPDCTCERCFGARWQAATAAPDTPARTFTEDEVRAAVHRAFEEGVDHGQALAARAASSSRDRGEKRAAATSPTQAPKPRSAVQDENARLRGALAEIHTLLGLTLREKRLTYVADAHTIAKAGLGV